MVGPDIHIECTLKAWRLPQAGLRKLLAWQLRRLGYARAGLSLKVCGDQAQQALNRRYRHKDKVTDILSFPSSDQAPRRGSSAYLGDLSLSLPFAWRQRGRFYPHFDQELAFLLLHGILHLLGQHHDDPAQERVMWRKNKSLRPPAALSARLLRGLGPVR